MESAFLLDICFDYSTFSLDKTLIQRFAGCTQSPTSIRVLCGCTPENEHKKEQALKPVHMIFFCLISPGPYKYPADLDNVLLIKTDISSPFFLSSRSRDMKANRFDWFRSNPSSDLKYVLMIRSNTSLWAKYKAIRRSGWSGLFLDQPPLPEDGRCIVGSFIAVYISILISVLSGSTIAITSCPLIFRISMST